MKDVSNQFSFCVYEKTTITDRLQMIAIVIEKKKLELNQQSKKNMYIENVAEFARVLLIITEMTFDCDWQRIQLLFFCQLAAITESCLKALLQFRYRDIDLTLIQDSKEKRSRLFIFLKFEFIKRFLEKKTLYVFLSFSLSMKLVSWLNRNEFKISKIIFDSTLILNSHVCLLSMLFHIKNFKTISITDSMLNSSKNLYNFEILNELDQQKTSLKNEILNKYVFCQMIQETNEFKIVLKLKLLFSIIRFRICRVSQITDFDQIIKSYLFRYVAVKVFNNSNE